jgi:hypothetical protein
MKFSLLFLAFFTSVISLTKAQTSPFEIAIEPISIPNLEGMQAYVFGQDDGKWVILGGRVDGLHRRQPFASFDIAGQNTLITVVDPASKQKWTTSISALQVSIQEQLLSTNMEFHQEGKYLYLLGGYGYSAATGDHITHPYLTAIDVPKLIEAVIKGTTITPYFRQIKDSMMAVTGGYLNKIFDIYYLTGGQKFTGRYNPMGPDHGPGFKQEYTNSIRRFSIDDDGVRLSIKHLKTTVDSVNLHRRDYNVVPQIMPSGEEGLTAFSGVFQRNADLPYLNCVNIDSTSHQVNPTFSQYYNHYHCAHMAVYSEKNREMHNVFFGGIAQYYDSAGVLIQDNDVPFVKTIARVSRDSNGNMAEYKLPVEMPSYLGAGSEFISLEDLSYYDNGVLKLDELKSDSTLVGYIFGGIQSSARNIFFTNTGTQSSASNRLFKVYVINKKTGGIDHLNSESINSLKMQVFPNPNEGDFKVKFNLQKRSKVELNIFDAKGQLIDQIVLENLKIGENIFSKHIVQFQEGGVYYISLETSFEKSLQMVVIHQ